MCIYSNIHFNFHCFSGTNAQAERVFSLMKAMWTEERSELTQKRIESMALIKYNSNQSCTDFYYAIKQDITVLEAIRSGKKYTHSKVSGHSSCLPLDTEPVFCCDDEEDVDF